MDKAELEKLLREAKFHHAEYETTTEKRDLEWPAWYASYIWNRLQGLSPDIAYGWATIDHLRAPGVK